MSKFIIFFPMLRNLLAKPILKKFILLRAVANNYHGRKNNLTAKRVTSRPKIKTHQPQAFCCREVILSTALQIDNLG